MSQCRSHVLSLMVLLSSICCDLVLPRPSMIMPLHDVFLPYITSHLEHVTRLDIVWDKYLPESLEADACSKRGKEVRRRVESSSAVPGNWQAFLCIDENKDIPSNEGDTTKQVLTTLQVDVLCTNRQDVSSLAPCMHARVKRLTLACFSTWKMLMCTKSTVNCPYVQLTLML